MRIYQALGLLVLVAAVILVSQDVASGSLRTVTVGVGAIAIANCLLLAIGSWRRDG